MAAKYDELVDLQTFRAGDTVRCLHNDESAWSFGPGAIGFGLIRSTSSTPRRTPAAPPTICSSVGASCRVDRAFEGRRAPLECYGNTSVIEFRAVGAPSGLKEAGHRPPGPSGRLRQQAAKGERPRWTAAAPLDVREPLRRICRPRIV